MTKIMSETGVDNGHAFSAKILVGQEMLMSSSNDLIGHECYRNRVVLQDLKHCWAHLDRLDLIISFDVDLFDRTVIRRAARTFYISELYIN